MPGVVKASQQGESLTDWNEVIAKALAFLVVNSAEWKDKRMTERAKFLMGLGLARKDAAAILGSTDESLRVNLGRVTSKRGKGNSAPRR